MGYFPVLVPTLSWDHRKAQFLRDSCVNGAVGAGEAPPRAASSAPVVLPRPCVQPSAVAELRAAQDA